MPTTIVFIDDAHTFGGAQIALAWAVRTILQNTQCSVVCVCTVKTSSTIADVAGQSTRLTFVTCPAALPLNVASFPLRIFSFFKLIHRLRRQGVATWWLNLPGIEFSLAPLVVLKVFGERHCSWLHTTETLAGLYGGRSSAKRNLNRIRDLIADHLLFRLHPIMATPSRAASAIVQKRTGKSNVVPHLYPTVAHSGSPRVAESHKKEPTRLWMIGRIEFGHKNNLAAIETLRVLKQRGAAMSLTVVGDGPDMAELRRACNDLHDGDVRFSGWSADPWLAVAPDDLVLLPSFREGMPLVGIEAMLRGVRMVTSPIPMFYEGIPEQFIAKEFSAEALANQVECVLKISRTEVLTLYSRSLVKFSAQHFIEAFRTLSEARAT